MYTRTQNLTGYKGKAKKIGADSHATPHRRFHHPEIDTDQFIIPPDSVYKFKKNGDTLRGGNKEQNLW
ncbi:hypothetical protein SAMD00019534_051610 [Acytostelium subglobosum LB1]|uniref:hypothetical protein n=1 Tax=Acytostelium subglobosum LB1 TaxID=1410327 RepID=UPI000644BF6E|nr:hypothetical protein SAMD00019534_051610 [Acytostelium subglobosum LB1]GAM21986.1 hypothetical protein SAMD00019534_051610 [Acytostelium subglobosum LB1]|eukprot:XP_012755086.1 hypothetical protein SAMD00019534_051610 [Acytostelium subglobosum LB1]